MRNKMSQRQCCICHYSLFHEHWHTVDAVQSKQLDLIGSVVPSQARLVCSSHWDDSFQYISSMHLPFLLWQPLVSWNLESPYLQVVLHLSSVAIHCWVENLDWFLGTQSYAYPLLHYNNKNYEFKKGVGIESTKKVQKKGFFWLDLQLLS